MLTTLSILSLDQGKLHPRPAEPVDRGVIGKADGLEGQSVRHAGWRAVRAAVERLLRSRVRLGGVPSNEGETAVTAIVETSADTLKPA